MAKFNLMPWLLYGGLALVVGKSALFIGPFIASWPAMVDQVAAAAVVVGAVWKLFGK